MEKEAEVDLVIVWVDSLFGEDSVVCGEEGAKRRPRERFGIVDDVVENLDVCDNRLTVYRASASTWTNLHWTVQEAHGR